MKEAGVLSINSLIWKTDDTYADIEEKHGSYILFENGTYGIVRALSMRRSVTLS